MPTYNCSALQTAVNQRQLRSAAQFWSTSRTVESAQSVAQRGSVVSTANAMHFAGLGALGCRAVDPLLQDLKVIIDTKGSSLSAASLASARAVYEEINSYAVYVPFLGTDCDKHVKELQAMLSSLRAELGAGAPPSLRPNADITPPPDDISPTAKFAIIGGIVVAGLISVAVITGQVAPLLRTVKRAF